MRFYLLLLVSVSITNSDSARAQLGSDWIEFQPRRDLHLGDKDQPKKTVKLTYEASMAESFGDPVTANYSFDKQHGVETFHLEKPGERAEVRIRNDYKSGSQQFEGWVTVRPPIERQMIFQIWGSGIPERATQMYLRGYNVENGTLKVYMSGQAVKTVAQNIYNREMQVNVIHLQEDAGGRILVYLDKEKVLDEADAFPTIINNDAGNYHKYGCYGSFESHFTSAGASWRHVRHFRDGKAPN